MLKRLLFYLLFFLTVFRINAQNNCASAVTISSLPFSSGTLTTCGTVDDYGAGLYCDLDYGDGEDYVFKYTATSTGNFTFTLGGAATWKIVSVHTACPPTSGNCVGSVTTIGSSGSGSISLSSGVLYYIYVDTWPSPDCGEFTLSITVPAPPPSNDICSGATNIVETTSCNPQTFNTSGALDNNETGDCITGTENSVWFKFTALTTSATVDVTGLGTFDPVIAALVNCGSTIRPTGGSCTDNTFEGGTETLSLTGLTIGSVYKIQVHDWFGGNSSSDEFTICVYSPLLPLDLTSINAKSINKSNKISWTTANEKNTAWHQIERANNELAEFKPIGKIAAAGNSLSSLDYSFMDENPLLMSYYRVRTIDLDGKESISPVVSVERSVDRFSIEKLYPNPTNNLLNIDIQSPESEEFTLNIFNSIGQNVFSKSSIFISKGISTETFDVSNLSIGYYHLQLKNNIHNINHQFCKQ